MFRFSYTANATTAETHDWRINRLFILWAFMLAMIALWSALIAPASAGSPTGGGQPTKGSRPDAPNCDPNWQVVASSNVTTPYKTYLRATDGEAPADMWAVGYAETGGITHAIIEHWDGTAWSLVAAPIDGSESSAFYGVAALATNDVWAVGYYKNFSASERTFIMHWDGTAWSIVSSPNVGTGGNFLKSVHSLYANNVWAVGYYASGSTYWTLTMRWNGTSWSTVSSPNVGTMSKLEAVALAANSHVWAVGRYISGGISYALTMRWNGTSWNTVSFNSSDNINAYLYGITALSPTDIWAVGYRQSCGFGASACTFLLHWNGSLWSLSGYSLENNPGFTNGLYSVRATSATSVWAVGYYNQNNTFYTLILKWDGSAWHRITSPNASGNNVFYGVGASGLSNVWAVGDHTAPDGLIEKWNGTQWSLYSSPAVNLTTSTFNATDSISSSDAWAVGYSRTNNTNTILFERWNGSSWNIVPAPAPPGSSALTGVAHLSATDAWAIGYQISATDFRTFILHWDGTAWSNIPSPNVGTRTNYLGGVYALNSTNVWAVGYYVDSLTLLTRTLVLYWNGSTWSIVSSPNLGSSNNTLYSVAGTSANDIWAVGSYYDGTGIRTLTLHWNGSTWSTVASPNTGTPTTANSLYSVTALTPTDAWAVGSYTTATGYNTLVMRWNGTSWNIVASPNTASSSNTLHSVDKVSATDIWAVGVAKQGNLQQTMVQHWDGTAWTIVATPNIGTLSNFLLAITVASPTDIYAVGGYGTPANYQTLVERYNPCN